MIDVLIVGGGPVGTFLASELALAGVTVSIVEKREQPVAHSRALGVHSRSLEIFDMRGLIDNFLAAGPTRPAFHFGFLPTLLDFSVLDTTHPYMLVIPQTQTETLLRARLEELGTTIQYGCNVVALEQNPEYVEVTIENTQGRSTLQAKFVVGCDGAGSTVRTQAGIAFPGSENDIASMIAELHVHKKPSFVTRFNEKGCVLAVPLGPDIYRFAIIDPQRAHIDTSVPVSFEEIQESLQRIVGTDFGIHDPQWFTRFGDRHAQAEVYHKGRVLLAGDAAHIHPPAGGQGLNVGLQDAMNLGWKLAAYLQGRAHYAVLQSYHTERHPVGQSLLQNTQVQMELMTSFSEAGQQLRSWISSLLQLQSVNRPLASQISGLSATYPPVFENVPVHPLIGSRLPDLSLRTPADSDEKLYRWLHNGNFVLLDFTDNIIPARLQHILEARKDLKMLQAHLAAPSAPLAQVQTMLIRPDSHVAWASDEQNHELRLHFLLEALSVWCNI